jgi:hypothetical protein
MYAAAKVSAAAHDAIASALTRLLKKRSASFFTAQPPFA